jgi:hypothetical protein
MRGVVVAALALASLVSVAEAAQSPGGGRVTRLKGLVTVERAGVSEPGRRGYILESGDTIKTGSDGVVQWWMADDSLFLLPTGSSLHIDEYASPSGRGGFGKSFFSLLKGAMRSVTGLVAKNDPQSYRVATPVATMGVRGTDFKLVYCNNDCARRKNTLRKSSLQNFSPIASAGPARLIRTAEKDKPVANGAYVKMEKLTGELCNDGGCAEVTAGVGSGCAYAPDSTTKPVVLPKCPDIFERFGDELEWEFDEVQKELYRDRRVPVEDPASPS